MSETSVNGCTFNGAQIDKDFTESMVALAKAAEANSMAIKAIAGMVNSFPSGTSLQITGDTFIGDDAEVFEDED